MRNHRQRFVRFGTARLVASGAVLVLTLAACGGSTTGRTNTPAGQSPTPTTTVSGQTPPASTASNGGGYY
jgi:hypothetical protein